MTDIGAQQYMDYRRPSRPLNPFGAVGTLLLLAILYNAFLAIVNAYATRISGAHVAATEIVILLCAIGLVALNARKFENILPPVIVIMFALLTFSYVSIMTGAIYPKAPRDLVLIAVFFMLGGLASERTLINTMRFATVTILLFMIVENYMTEIYAAIFKPAVYYANTRGVEEFSLDETGLFRNSLGFADRFSFGLSKHRLSSIFLEQVSFANFAMVLSIFTCTFWDRIKRWDRILFLATAVLMVLTNSSRTASAICLLIFIGYHLFPMLPRRTNLLYMPTILLLSWIFFYDPKFIHATMSDDLKGRFGNTMSFLGQADISYLTGAGPEYIAMTGDSGYAYLIFTQTVFGLIFFWLFTSLIVPQADAPGKRFSHATAIYIAVNLMVGAAIFSIKVSAPLWFMAGYLYYRKFRQGDVRS